MFSSVINCNLVVFIYCSFLNWHLIGLSSFPPQFSYNHKIIDPTMIQKKNTHTHKNKKKSKKKARKKNKRNQVKHIFRFEL